MTTQKEFMVGCLIGSVIGSLASLAIPKGYVDNFLQVNKKRKHKSNQSSAIKKNGNIKSIARRKKAKHKA